MIELKTPAQIGYLREAGRVVAHALAAVREHAVAGVTLRELDEVGRSDPADEALIAATDAALRRGIDVAHPGDTLGDIGHAIGPAARAAGYGLLADNGGHDVGRAMHEDPPVPNEGRPGRGYRLRPGLVIAIEPMLISGGTDRAVTDSDGWTVRAASGARAAHSEHTIAITDDGPIVLTAP